jgi:hypothetical protein
VSARRLLRLAVALLLGALAAVLVSCGGSGAGLIPARDAGPLREDFQAVEAAALAGNGRCAATEAALSKTESDFRNLPAGVDAGLRGRLSEGVSKLHELALELCTQPAGGTTTTSPAVETTPPASTTTETSTTSTTPGTSTEGASEGGTSPGAGEGSGTEGGTAPGASGGEGQSGEGAAGAGGEAPKSGGAGGGAAGGGATGGAGPGETGAGGGKH